MPYVILMTETNVIVSSRSTRKSRYKTERAAKAGATRLINAGELTPGTFTVCDHSAVKTRTRLVRNLMTGEMVEEDVNTPYSCSVASESYWSN